MSESTSDLWFKSKRILWGRFWKPFTSPVKIDASRQWGRDIIDTREWYEKRYRIPYSGLQSYMFQLLIEMLEEDYGLTEENSEGIYDHQP